MRTLNLFFAVLALVFTSACASYETASPNADLAVPDSTSAITIGDLRIRPWDQVRVNVFGVDDFNGTYRVDPEGKIRLPLLGPVLVRGYTPFELERRLEALLGESYLQDPMVTVSVESTKSAQFTVDGSISKPGIYPIQGRMTLLQAVAVAGGPARGANRKKVVIFRVIEGEKMAAAFNLEKIRAGDAEDPEVFGNDVIVVDGSEASAAYGEILRSLPLIGLFLAL